MSIVISEELENKLKAQAAVAGLSLDAYIESLLHIDEGAEAEITALALEGFHSGEAIETGPAYWAEKHRLLDESLNRPGRR